MPVTQAERTQEEAPSARIIRHEFNRKSCWGPIFASGTIFDANAETIHFSFELQTTHSTFTNDSRAIYLYF